MARGRFLLKRYSLKSEPRAQPENGKKCRLTVFSLRTRLFFYRQSTVQPIRAVSERYSIAYYYIVIPREMNISKISTPRTVLLQYFGGCDFPNALNTVFSSPAYGADYPCPPRSKQCSGLCARRRAGSGYFMLRTCIVPVGLSECRRK